MLEHDATAMLDVHGSPPGVVPTRADRDSSLVGALRRGEPTAADSLVAAYGDRAFRLAIRITGSAEDAEEIVQDALWSVIRKIETFRGDSAFGSWLYRVVANAAYQRLRKRRGQSADVSLDTVFPVFDQNGRHAEPVADWSKSIDDPARQTELRMLLEAAIEELPADYRAVILLRDGEGLSYQEIVEALGLSVGNVKTRLHRARLFLRQRLGAHFSMAGVASLAGRRMSGGRSPSAVPAFVLPGARPAPARTGREASACQAPTLPRRPPSRHATNTLLAASEGRDRTRTS